MRQSLNGCEPVRGTLAFSNWKTKKHAKCRRTCFCCRPPTLLTPFQNKLSQALGLKPARVLAKALQQLPDREAVVVEDRLTGSPLPAYPMAKRSEEGWILNRLIGKGCGDFASTSQVFQEYACTIKQI
jgi:hypothetical protein